MGNSGFCCYGLRDPVNHLLMKKAVSLMHNFPENTLAPLFRRCSNHDPKTHVHHMHQRVEGWCKGYGRRSTYSQVYPKVFCQKLASLISEYLAGGKRPALYQHDLELLVDIIETEADNQDVLLALRNDLDSQDISEPLLGLSQQSESFAMVSYALAVPVKDYQVMELIAWANSLPNHTEIVVQGDDNTVSKRVFKLLRHVRQHFLPLQKFTGCSVLRGTFGSQAPTNQQDEDSYCVMWKKKEPRLVYVTQVSTTHEASFEPRLWTIVLFWGQSSASRPDIPNPVPHRVGGDDPDQPMDDHMPDRPPSSRSDRSMDDQMNGSDSELDPDPIPPVPPGPPPDNPGQGLPRSRSRSPAPTPRPDQPDPPNPPDPPQLPPGHPDDIVIPVQPIPIQPVPLQPDPIPQQQQIPTPRTVTSASTPVHTDTEPSASTPVTPRTNVSSGTSIHSTPHKRPRQDNSSAQPSNAQPSSSSQQHQYPDPPVPSSQSSSSHQDQSPQHSDADDEFSDLALSTTDYAPDIVLFTDAKDWRKYGEIPRVLAQTASFSFPQGPDGPLNADFVEHKNHSFIRREW